MRAGLAEDAPLAHSGNRVTQNSTQRISFSLRIVIIGMEVGEQPCNCLPRQASHKNTVAHLCAIARQHVAALHASKQRDIDNQLLSLASACDIAPDNCRRKSSRLLA